MVLNAQCPSASRASALCIKVIEGRLKCPELLSFSAFFKDLQRQFYIG